MFLNYSKTDLEYNSAIYKGVICEKEREKEREVWENVLKQGMSFCCVLFS